MYKTKKSKKLTFSQKLKIAEYRAYRRHPYQSTITQTIIPVAYGLTIAKTLSPNDPIPPIILSSGIGTSAFIGIHQRTKGFRDARKKLIKAGYQKAFMVKKGDQADIFSGKKKAEAFKEDVYGKGSGARIIEGYSKKIDILKDKPESFKKRKRV